MTAAAATWLNSDIAAVHTIAATLFGPLADTVNAAIQTGTRSRPRVRPTSAVTCSANMANSAAAARTADDASTGYLPAGLGEPCPAFAWNHSRRKDWSAEIAPPPTRPLKVPIAPEPKSMSAPPPPKSPPRAVSNQLRSRPFATCDATEVPAPAMPPKSALPRFVKPTRFENKPPVTAPPAVEIARS